MFVTENISLLEEQSDVALGGATAAAARVAVSCGNLSTPCQVDGGLGYLQKITELLKNSKENIGGSEEFEVVTKQLESLGALAAVVAARWKPDPQLRKQTVKTAETGQAGCMEEDEGTRNNFLKYDGAMDDDEVLLSFFKQLDQDESFTIEMSELLRSVGHEGNLQCMCSL